MPPRHTRIQWSSPIGLVLVAMFFLGMALRVGIAVELPNGSHPDETFQTREPAHRLAYGYGVITWEWRDGIRSWVFPAFLATVMRGTDWMGAGSSGYLLGIAIVLSLISLTTVWFSFVWAYRASGVLAAVIAAGASATWFELVYYGPKALTEVVAAHVLLPGLYLGAFGESIPERTRLFVSGLFFGLALALRPPLAPVIIFAAAACSLQNWRVRLPAMVAGILGPCVLFGLVDAITWSFPFQSFIRYFWFNIVEGKSAASGMGGSRPWNWYLPVLIKRLGPVAVLSLIGVRRSPFLGWVALLILLSHSVVPHKEFRFIYPMIPIAVTLAGLGAADALAHLSSWMRWPRSTMPAYIVGLVFCVCTSAILARFFPLWSRYSGNLIALQTLSRDAKVCGVALQIVPVFSGGYTYLHRNVPIFPTPHDADIKRLTPSFNAIVTSLPLLDDTFKLTKCWNGTCLYQRQGSCTPSPGDEVNEYLKRNGN